MNLTHMTKKRQVLVMKKMSKGMREEDGEKREDGRQFEEDPNSDPCTPMRIRALVRTSGDQPINRSELGSI